VFIYTKQKYIKINHNCAAMGSSDTVWHKIMFRVNGPLVGLLPTYLPMCIKMACAIFSLSYLSKTVRKFLVLKCFVYLVGMIVGT
jgi:hypothetical protein